MPPVIPLYNHHYFKSLMQLMEKNGTYMCIDGSGQLWHMDDMPLMLSQFPDTHHLTHAN